MKKIIIAAVLLLTISSVSFADLGDNLYDPTPSSEPILKLGVAKNYWLCDENFNKRFLGQIRDTFEIIGNLKKVKVPNFCIYNPYAGINPNTAMMLFFNSKQEAEKCFGSNCELGKKFPAAIIKSQKVDMHYSGIVACMRMVNNTLMPFSGKDCD